MPDTPTFPIPDATLLTIDKWITLTSERSMFSADEVRDLLLDLRQLHKAASDAV